MTTAQSKDGTVFAYKAFAKEFTVYNYDRRGRGDSGNTLPWSVEREVEDIPQIVQQTTLIETVQTRPNTPFGGMYWGRLLNISVGIERPLSRRTVFAVEPYLKYPIGPLTQENLSIGSAGVSIRVGIR